jgi:cytochrome P450
MAVVPDLEWLTSGSRRALAKSITLIESKRALDREAAVSLIESALPHTGNSLRVGISGVPGVGKSTFIESFGLHLIKQDKDVIDPEVYKQVGHPQHAFAWLRANDPLRMVEPDGYRPFWVVTRYADITEIEKQPEIFTSEPRPFLKLTNELFAGDDPEMQRIANDPLSIFDTSKDIYQYFSDLTDKLREHPERLQRFKGIVHDEKAVKLAVEEMIRWTTPVVQFSRTAERDYDLRGKTIKKGDTVGLMYASASFDADIFDNSFKFNIERKPNRHLAFAIGAHQCIDLILARLEMRIFFEQLIPRIAEMESVQDAGGVLFQTPCVCGGHPTLPDVEQVKCEPGPLLRKLAD